MSSHHRYLLDAIQRYQTDDIRKRVEKLSNGQVKHLLKGDKSLLDEAASRLQNDVMAILISNGIIRWDGSERNNRIFIALIEDYIEDQDIGHVLHKP